MTSRIAVAHKDYDVRGGGEILAGVPGRRAKKDRVVVTLEFF